MESTVIKKLDNQTISALKDEISAANWQIHSNGNYQKTGALKDGTTCWLRKTDGHLNVLEDSTANYPVTMQVVTEYMGNNNLGRIYWHRLKLGNEITRHTDTRIPYVPLLLLHRYQVYLNIPIDAELILDNKLQDTTKFENSIVDFNLNLPHSYKNNSESEFIFLVFDIVRSDKK